VTTAVSVRNTRAADTPAAIHAACMGIFPVREGFDKDFGEASLTRKAVLSC